MKPARRFVLQVVVLSAAAMISGCKVGPDFRPPQANVPAAYIGGTNEPSGAAQPTQLAEWWRTFNDPTLTELVERVGGSVSSRGCFSPSSRRMTEVSFSLPLSHYPV